MYKYFLRIKKKIIVGILNWFIQFKSSPKVYKRIFLYLLVIFYRILLLGRTTVKYIFFLRRSYKSTIPVISVGNLRMGGSGKTSFIEYLIRYFLIKEYKIAIISKGYRRETIGLRVVDEKDNHSTVGDEAYQIYQKFREHTLVVIVNKNRKTAIQYVQKKLPDTQIILIDDGFQDTSIQYTINILLTDFQNIFYKDDLLPVGYLREPKKVVRRSDLIIVTKSLLNLSYDYKNYIRSQINKYFQKELENIFFVTIQYNKPESIWLNPEKKFSKNIILFTGIAASEYFVQYIQKTCNLLYYKSFLDHHNFTVKDIEEIVSIYHEIQIEEKCILTTEKDMVRLLEPALKNLLENLPVFYIPIEVVFESSNTEYFFANKLEALLRE